MGRGWEFVINGTCCASRRRGVTVMQKEIKFHAKIKVLFSVTLLRDVFYTRSFSVRSNSTDRKSHPQRTFTIRSSSSPISSSVHWLQSRYIMMFVLVTTSVKWRWIMEIYKHEMHLRLQNKYFNDMRLQGCPNGILKFFSYFRDNTMSMYPKINTLLLLAKIMDANSENLKKIRGLSSFV